MSIQLFAFDLDGTALQSDLVFSETNQQALAQAAEKGIVLIPATGRMLHEIPPFFHECPYIRYFITSNGASVIDRLEKKPIYQNLLPAETAKAILRLLSHYDIATDIYMDGYAYADQAVLAHLGDYRVSPIYEKYIRSHRIPIQNMENWIAQLQRPVEKFNLLFREESTSQAVRKELEQFSTIGLTSAHGYNIEVNGHTTSKGDALQHLSTHLGVAPSSILAIGDSLNDMEMLRYAGICVGMKNAIPEVLEQVDFITLSNAEDGFAYAIRKFILEENGI